MKLHGGPSYKIVLVGESGVGKSTLMFSFINGTAPSDLRPTIGTQCSIHAFNFCRRRFKYLRTTILFSIYGIPQDHKNTAQ